MLNISSNSLNLGVLNNYNSINNKKRFNNLSPLRCDTVSFGALKKSKFSGIDLLIVNKFKAPIEKFKTNKDFQYWCKQKVVKITQKDYQGRQEETRIQRREILSNWFNYLQNETDEYNNAVSLLIVEGVTKNLEPYNDKLPPVLNKEVLAQTIDEIQNKITENPKSYVNFLRLYQTNLQKSVLDSNTHKSDEIETGWVIIPSFRHNYKHFEENVEKLQVLSHNNWCTKSYNAAPYLYEGDFHIYLENGEPKIGVRFIGNEIKEIQGEKNNAEISSKYFDIVKEHINGENLSFDVKMVMNILQRIKEKAEDFKRRYSGATNEEILKAFGIEVKKDKNGFLIISNYDQPKGNYNGLSFENIEINENELFKNVKKIKGDANFTNSQITNLGNLESIGRNAYFEDSQIIDLGNLESIGSNAYFGNSQITNLGNLKSIGGIAYINPDQQELAEKLKDRNIKIYSF